MLFPCRVRDKIYTGIAAGDLAEGQIVTLNESGNPVQFYIAKQDYEPGLNGTGRVLVVRKDVYDIRQWNIVKSNAWASCSLRSWMNVDYKSKLDPEVQEAMSTTKYYYTPGDGNNQLTTKADSVFALSATEISPRTLAFVNAEGAQLPISNILTIAHLNSQAVEQSTRSPNIQSTTDSVVYVTDSGGIYNYSSGSNSTREYGSRPALTLPATFKFQETEVIS